MLKGFYVTDKDFIVSEAKRIFDKDVCITCHGQLVEAYNQLNTYYLNKELMAKKKSENTAEKYTLKPEFVGSTYVNGKVSIALADVPSDEVEIFFNAEQIKTYFDINE